MDRSMTRLLPRLFGELPTPPLEAEAAPNHLDTRIVRENSFLDVPSFLGPVFSVVDTSSSLSENNVVHVVNL